MLTDKKKTVAARRRLTISRVLTLRGLIQRFAQAALAAGPAQSTTEA
jgi:hypothetical protein